MLFSAGGFSLSQFRHGNFFLIFFFSKPVRYLSHLLKRRHVDCEGYFKLIPISPTFIIVNFAFTERNKDARIQKGKS